MPASACTRPSPPFLSGPPFLGHTGEFLRDPVALVSRGHAAHGEVFALRLGGRPAAVLLGPEAQRVFFEETDRRLALRDAYPFLVPMFDERTYFLAAPEEYREQRAILLPTFSGARMEGYLAAMVAEVDRWLAGLGEAGELDLVESVGPVVMWVAARAFLGEEFRERLGREFFQVFRDFSAGMEAVLPLWLPLPRFRRRDRARAIAHAMIGREIARRRAGAVAEPDFLSDLIAARTPAGEPLPDPVLANLVMVLVWAGHETTVGQTAWAILELLRHPEELAAVRTEVAVALAGAARLDLPATRSLRRLEGALKEAERLRPVAHILMRQVVEPLEAGGFSIPAGWRVLVCPAVAHRLPAIFRDPERYDPGRFAPDRAEDRRPYTLIGFGGSTHRCLGVNFAYLEMKVILALLLHGYELELVDRDPRPVPGAGTRWPRRPCRVRYRRRQAPILSEPAPHPHAAALAAAAGRLCPLAAGA